MTDEEADDFRHVLAAMAGVPVEDIWFYRPKPEPKEKKRVLPKQDNRQSFPSYRPKPPIVRERAP